jgi:hypothetical protein
MERLPGSRLPDEGGDASRAASRKSPHSKGAPDVGCLC